MTDTGTASAAGVRLFAALRLPGEAAADLRAAIIGLHVARAVRPENWHITVAFIGALPAGRLTAVTAALSAGSRQVEPLELRVAGGGRFGRGRYSVVYAGVDGDTDGLNRLAAGVREQLRAAELPWDRKQFRPHVTLARPSHRLSHHESAEDLVALRRYQGPQWKAHELMLYRSSPGPKYEALAALPLG